MVTCRVFVSGARSGFDRRACCRPRVRDREVPGQVRPQQQRAVLCPCVCGPPGRAGRAGVSGAHRRRAPPGNPLSRDSDGEGISCAGRAWLGVVPCQRGDAVCEAVRCRQSCAHHA